MSAENTNNDHQPEGLGAMTGWAVYTGSYQIGGSNFGCWCVGTSFNDAQERMDSWAVGAKVEGVTDKRPRVPAPGESGFEHWLIYLSWLAMSAKKFRNAMFADDGMIHELMHLHEGVPLVGQSPLNDYYALCRALHLLPPNDQSLATAGAGLKPTEQATTRRCQH